ncbi:hypothetical protein [Scale drop disease virus]|nr:hypothetical protein [Scale drop disease virus]QXJ13606.1 ORF016L [Scale drop disease virus]
MDIVKVPLEQPDTLLPVPNVSGLDLKLEGLKNTVPVSVAATDQQRDIQIIEDPDITKKRNELSFKRAVLTKMFPDASIPEITAYTDPDLMADRYKNLTKELELEQSVSDWKRYMVVFVCCIEVFLSKLNLNMKGFAHQQINAMKSYDALLAELVEKNHTPDEEKSSVEMRLLMAVGMNVALFIFGNMITSGGESEINLVEMFLRK